MRIQGIFFLIVLLMVPALTIIADANFHYFGKVVDDDGNSIKGVSIKIVDQTTSRVGSSTGVIVNTVVTDEEGLFSFYLDWGTFEFTLSKSGYATQSIKYSGVNVPNIDVGSITLKRNIAIAISTTVLAAAPGSHLILNVQISNTGSSDEIFNLKVISETGWLATIRNEAGEVETLLLRIGSSVSLNLVIDVPLKATQGQVSLVAIGRTNTTKTLTIHVEGEPDNIISCAYPSKVTSSGGVISFRLAIKNPSSDASIISLKTIGVPEGWIAYFLNDDKEEIESVYLQATSTSTITLRIQVPTTAEIGMSYEFVAMSTMGERTGKINLAVRVGNRSSTLELTSKYPSQSIQLGVTTIYPITLSASSSELVQLSAKSVPEGWAVVFKTQDGRQVNSILLDSEIVESINVAVTPSLNSNKGEYTFTVAAIGNIAEGNLTLTAGIVGSYSLVMELDSLYLQTKAKNSEIITVTITNKGYSSLTNIVLDISSPDGWTTTFSPLKITTLNPNEKATILMTVTVPDGAAPKDYLVTVQAVSREVSATTQTIRMTVSVESSWTIYGLALLLIAVVAFSILYRKLRRR